MTQRTPFYALHLEAGARMVDFGGWEMPINYGSQIDEHHQVRQDAGMFDVSHMTIVDLQGSDCKAYLQRLLANDVAKLKVSGKALYTGMLNESGGVIDDLIVYYIDDENYRLVVNASTRDKDLQWMKQQSESFSVTIKERPDFAMLAIQGPKAIEKTQSILSATQQQASKDISAFFAVESEGLFIARTGYTGEDGYEVMVPSDQVETFWANLLAAGVKPCGLGARDTLRLEAGMNLYGSDMDETISPLQANMAWTVAWQPEERDFIGRQALVEQKQAGVSHKQVGLVLQGKGVLRAHMKVIAEGIGEGEVTSGTMSPTLKKSIALARVPTNCGPEVQVDIRGKQVAATVVKPCFVRNGKALL